MRINGLDATHPGELEHWARRRAEDHARSFLNGFMFSLTSTLGGLTTGQGAHFPKAVLLDEFERIVREEGTSAHVIEFEIWKASHVDD